MNSSYKGRTFFFGDFHLHAYDGRLYRSPDDQCIDLSPTLLEILLLLLEDSGEVVAKQKFLDRVWSGRVVEEGNLSRNVSSLRKLLQDDAQHPQYIETAAGRGYRFVAEVTEQAELSGSVTPTAESTRSKQWLKLSWAALTLVLISAAMLLLPNANLPVSSQMRSLVVLPIENLSADGDDSWFADGMTEELISALSNIADLDVAPRMASMQYKDSDKTPAMIAAELDVSGVLESSVLRTGDGVTLSLRLIDASHDRAIWTATFQRELSQAFSMHGEIALQIANELGIELSAAQIARLDDEIAINDSAHEAYLLGRFFKNKRTVDSLYLALEYFDRAIQAEPDFSRAYAAKADTFLSLASWQGPSRNLWPMARAAADHAVSLNPYNVEALVVRAGALLCHDLDAQAAEPVYLRALSLNPNNILALHRYAYSLMTQGRFNESIQWARKALRLNPVSANLNSALGQRFHYARRYDEALQQLQHALTLDASLPGTHRVLGLTYLQTNRAPEAIVALKRAHELGGGPGVVGELGYAYARAGQIDGALTQLARLESLAQEGRDTAYGFALVHKGLGDEDKAFAWLERAYGERDFRLIFLRIEPIWDDLRADPRFEKFLQRIGFEPLETHPI